MLNEDKPARLGVVVVTTIVVAVLLSALISGLWYYLYGRKEKRTPETPQTMNLSEPQRETSSKADRIFCTRGPDPSRLAVIPNYVGMGFFFICRRTSMPEHLLGYFESNRRHESSRCRSLLAELG